MEIYRLAEGCFKKEDKLKEIRQSIALLLVYLSIITGCGFGWAYNKKADSMMKVNEVKEISYRFIDASVPPQYHRSYTITVTANKSHIVVDSYGKVLAEKDYKISRSQFSDLLSSFQKNKIRNCSLNEEEGCTGGTSEKISMNDGSKEVFNGWVYHCGGEDYGNMCGDISDFAVEAKKVIPDLDKLVK